MSKEGIPHHLGHVQCGPCCETSVIGCGEVVIENQITALIAGIEFGDCIFFNELLYENSFEWESDLSILPGLIADEYNEEYEQRLSNRLILGGQRITEGDCFWQHIRESGLGILYYRMRRCDCPHGNWSARLPGTTGNVGVTHGGVQMNWYGIALGVIMTIEENSLHIEITGTVFLRSHNPFEPVPETEQASNESTNIRVIAFRGSIPSLSSFVDSNGIITSDIVIQNELQSAQINTQLGGPDGRYVIASEGSITIRALDIDQDFSTSQAVIETQATGGTGLDAPCGEDPGGDPDDPDYPPFCEEHPDHPECEGEPDPPPPPPPPPPPGVYPLMSCRNGGTVGFVEEGEPGTVMRATLPGGLEICVEVGDETTRDQGSPINEPDTAGEYENCAECEAQCWHQWLAEWDCELGVWNDVAYGGQSECVPLGEEPEDKPTEWELNEDLSSKEVCIYEMWETSGELCPVEDECEAPESIEAPPEPDFDGDECCGPECTCTEQQWEDFAADCAEDPSGCPDISPTCLPAVKCCYLIEATRHIYDNENCSGAPSNSTANGAQVSADASAPCTWVDGAYGIFIDDEWRVHFDAPIGEGETSKSEGASPVGSYPDTPCESEDGMSIQYVDISVSEVVS